MNNDKHEYHRNLDTERIQLVQYAIFRSDLLDAGCTIATVCSMLRYYSRCFTSVIEGLREINIK